MSKSDLDISAEALGELIGGIYDGALTPGEFEIRTDTISRRLNSYSPMLFVRSRDAAAGYPVTEVVSEGLMPPEASEQMWTDFIGYYSRIDPSGPAVLAGGPGMHNYAELPNADTYFASEFYNDFCLPLLCPYAAGAWRPHGPEHLLLTSYVRGEEFGAYRADEIRFLSVLEPHISRAAQLALRLRASAAHMVLAEQALDRMAEGVIFVEASGRIVFANHSAERILADADGLGCVRRTLVGHDSICHKRLRTAIAAASGQTSHHEKACELAVTRPSGCHPYRVLIAPVMRGSLQPHGAASATAMLFIGHADRDFDSAEAWLRVAYGLTATEARLANELAAGYSLKEAAVRIAIGIGTARGHLKSIFAKMGIGRQSDLIRVLLSSTGVRATPPGRLEN